MRFSASTVKCILVQVHVVGQVVRWTSVLAGSTNPSWVVGGFRTHVGLACTHGSGLWPALVRALREMNRSVAARHGN